MSLHQPKSFLHPRMKWLCQLLHAWHFRQFQDLVRRIADSLQIPLEEVKEPNYQLLDILYTASSGHFALPVNDALLDSTKVIRDTLTTILPTCKRGDKKYYVPSKDSIFIFSSLS